MKRTFAAALFSFLAVAVPARAATIRWELTDVQVANPILTPGDPQPSFSAGT